MLTFVVNYLTMSIRKRKSPKPLLNYPRSMSRRDASRGGATPLQNQVDARPTFVYNTSARPSGTEVKLRVVRLSDVLLHEQIETKRVERLVERFETDQLLKNPPIVVESGGKYILLDGATRITALQCVGCRDVLVQIVEYDAPGLVLETWNHMLIDLPLREFLADLRQLPDLDVAPMPFGDAEDALARRASIGTLLLSDGAVFALRLPRAQLAEQARALNQVVAAYAGRGEMYRVAHTDLECLLAENARLSALIVFPRFQPDEIRHLALNESKLPMGITRHIIPGRAMRINIPLQALRADQPLEQKNAWLDEWMKTKMRERQVRFYQEPVFLFDE